MTIEEYFGTLRGAVTELWSKHLQSDIMAEHEVLNELYDDLLEKMDALVEAWQADHDKVMNYIDTLADKKMSALEYLKELKRIALEGRSELMDSPELESLVDDVVATLDSGIYKLKNLVHESKAYKSLSTFLSESIHKDVTESYDGLSAAEMNRKCKGKKMVDYNGDEYTFVKAIDCRDSEIKVMQFLRAYDSTGAMADEIDDCPPGTIIVAALKNNICYTFEYGAVGIIFK